MAGEETYDFGECTWYVASQLPWVQGGWGDAWMWPGRASSAGFGITDQPTVDAVVAYGRSCGYSDFGHVAIVEAVYTSQSFLVREMNFTGWDQVDERVSNAWCVEAFILPPGGGGGRGGSGPLGGAGTAVDAARVEWQGLADVFNEHAPQAIDWLIKFRQLWDVF